MYICRYGKQNVMAISDMVLYVLFWFCLIFHDKENVLSVAYYVVNAIGLLFAELRIQEFTQCQLPHLSTACSSPLKIWSVILIYIC